MSETVSEMQQVPRGGYAKGRAKRDEIVRAAILAFADVGYHGASLRDIAARAGISHPGLLHHFPTKAALLEAVLEHRDEVDLEAFGEEFAQGADYFEALVHLTERNMLRRPLVELFAGLSTEATTADHPAHAYFKRRYARVCAQFADELAKKAEQGRLAPGLDPVQTARNIVALMDGLQVQWLLSLDGPKEDRVDMAEQLCAYLATILTDGD